MLVSQINVFDCVVPQGSCHKFRSSQQITFLTRERGGKGGGMEEKYDRMEVNTEFVILRKADRMIGMRNCKSSIVSFNYLLMACRFICSIASYYLCLQAAYSWGM